MARTPRTRHLRHRLFRRIQHQRNLQEFLDSKSTELTGTAAQYTFTASAQEFQITGHGFVVGEGPFSLSTDDTLPAGLSPDNFYWVYSVIDANTIQLTTGLGYGAVTVADPGTGTHTMHKAESEAGVFEYLRQNPPEVVENATDADNL